jgi:hypothetical protein
MSRDLQPSRTKRAREIELATEAYYDNLTDEERAELIEWGEFATAEFLAIAAKRGSAN